MVEAAMVLPILILVVFSMMLVMVWYYETHQGQLSLHKQMLEQSKESDAAFRVKTRTQEHQSRLDGAVNHILKMEKQHRIYDLKPAKWIRVGEMMVPDDG